MHRGQVLAGVQHVLGEGVAQDVGRHLRQPRPPRVLGDDLLDAPPPPWADVILAGDICYEKPLAERVMAWLGQARAAGAVVLIGDPGRSYFPRTGLVKLAEYQVPTTRELEDLEVKKTSVWTLP